MQNNDRILSVPNLVLGRGEVPLLRVQYQFLGPSCMTCIPRHISACQRPRREALNDASGPQPHEHFQFRLST